MTTFVKVRINAALSAIQTLPQFLENLAEEARFNIVEGKGFDGKELRAVRIESTLIGELHGAGWSARFYEHPLDGDEAPLMLLHSDLVNGEESFIESSDWWEIPTIDEYAGV